MGRTRWNLEIAAMACGLAIIGEASAHDGWARTTEADAIGQTLAWPFLPERGGVPSLERLRATRDATIFLPHAEFLFAPVPRDSAPR